MYTSGMSMVCIPYIWMYLVYCVAQRNPHGGTREGIRVESKNHRGDVTCTYLVPCHCVVKLPICYSIHRNSVFDKVLYMAYQMAQEGALWPSVVITLGPCWRKVKLSWANIANGSSTIPCWQLENAYIYYINVIYCN